MTDMQNKTDCVRVVTITSKGVCHSDRTPWGWSPSRDNL